MYLINIILLLLKALNTPPPIPPKQQQQQEAINVSALYGHSLSHYSSIPSTIIKFNNYLLG